MYTYTINTHMCPYTQLLNRNTCCKDKKAGEGECVDTRKADHPPIQGMDSGGQANAGDGCRLSISPSAPVELLSILGVGRHKSNKVARSRGTHRKWQLSGG